jgi:hypothetical protein
MVRSNYITKNLNQSFHMFDYNIKKFNYAKRLNKSKNWGPKTMFRLPQYMLTVSPGGGGKAAGE